MEFLAEEIDEVDDVSIFFLQAEIETVRLYDDDSNDSNNASNNGSVSNLITLEVEVTALALNGEIFQLRLQRVVLDLLDQKLDVLEDRIRVAIAENKAANDIVLNNIAKNQPKEDVVFSTVNIAGYTMEINRTVIIVAIVACTGIFTIAVVIAYMMMKAQQQDGDDDDEFLVTPDLSFTPSTLKWKATNVTTIESHDNDNDADDDANLSQHDVESMPLSPAACTIMSVPFDEISYTMSPTSVENGAFV